MAGAFAGATGDPRWIARGESTRADFDGGRLRLNDDAKRTHRVIPAGLRFPLGFFGLGPLIDSVICALQLHNESRFGAAVNRRIARDSLTWPPPSARAGAIAGRGSGRNRIRHRSSGLCFRVGRNQKPPQSGGVIDDCAGGPFPAFPCRWPRDGDIRTACWRRVLRAGIRRRRRRKALSEGGLGVFAESLACRRSVTRPLIYRIRNRAMFPFASIGPRCRRPLRRGTGGRRRRMAGKQWAPLPRPEMSFARPVSNGIPVRRFRNPMPARFPGDRAEEHRRWASRPGKQ